jgi:hypothetical protein
MLSSHEWTRVVVLRPAARGPLDEHLKAAFTQREWFAVEHTEPHQAMAELCLREKAQTARAGWGLQRVEKSALLIIDPFEFCAARSLIAAAQRYLPQASVWTFADGEFTAVGKACTEGLPGADVRSREARGPKIARGAEPPWTINHAPTRQIPPTSPVIAPSPDIALTSGSDEEPALIPTRISREEIDMLLHADDEETPSGGDDVSDARAMRLSGSGEA